MESRVERYRAYTATCLATDYDSPASVRRHNRAADEMRRLVGEPGAVAELLPLLDEPTAARWLAFQLVESGGLSDDVIQRCLAVVRALAAGGDAEAMGARMWLRERRHAEPIAAADGGA
jgi:hypothetical protein